MFCDEEIFGVYYGRRTDGGSASFVDCYHDKEVFAFYTARERLILETRSYYIVLDASGAKLLDKTKPVRTLAVPGETVESAMTELSGMGTEYEIENVLFTGERLIAAEGRECTFDHFALRIVPCGGADGVPKLTVPVDRGFLPVYGCDGLIVRHCACGGTGEMTVDAEGQWAVRCAACGRATDARPYVFYAAEDWNRGGAYRVMS